MKRFCMLFVAAGLADVARAGRGPTRTRFQSHSHQNADGNSLPRSMPCPFAEEELPEIMVMNDGTKVTTRNQWEKRREEMKRILAYYAVGQMPPPPGNVKGQEIKSETLLDGSVKYRLVHLTFGPWRENSRWTSASSRRVKGVAHSQRLFCKAAHRRARPRCRVNRKARIRGAVRMSC